MHFYIKIFGRRRLPSQQTGSSLRPGGPATRLYRRFAQISSVTTIDHISGGRVELGIGAGWPGENRRFGVDFWTRRERAERFVEALEVITRLWT